MEQFGTTNIGLAIFLALGATALVGIIFFPSEIMNWLHSDNDIKRQSDAKLAEMNRNIAERKARRKR